MFAGERIAVIGAGLAGCRLAQQLKEQGALVEVFDKSRGTGGRLAAARLGDGAADLGAPIIEAAVAEALVGASMPLERWSHRRASLTLDGVKDASAWVANPRASALTRQLLKGVELHSQTRITALTQTQEGHWQLSDDREQSFGPYQRVMLAVPAPQAVPLLAPATELQQAAADIRMAPAWVMLIELNARPERLAELDWLDGEHPVLARVCRDGSKPGRGGEVWQLMANPQWSARHQDSDPEWIAGQLLEAFAEIAAEPIEPQRQRVHRWLYADVAAASVGTQSLSSPLACDGTLGVCGDWVCGAGMEAALKSADLLIRALEEHR